MFAGVEKVADDIAELDAPLANGDPSLKFKDHDLADLAFSNF